MHKTYVVKELNIVPNKNDFNYTLHCNVNIFTTSQNTIQTSAQVWVSRHIGIHPTLNVILQALVDIEKELHDL
jgi:hypothetical protein